MDIHNGSRPGIVYGFDPVRSLTGRSPYCWVKGQKDKNMVASETQVIAFSRTCPSHDEARETTNRVRPRPRCHVREPGPGWPRKARFTCPCPSVALAIHSRAGHSLPRADTSTERRFNHELGYRVLLRAALPMSPSCTNQLRGRTCVGRWRDAKTSSGSPRTMSGNEGNQPSRCQRYLTGEAPGA